MVEYGLLVAVLALVSLSAAGSLEDDGSTQAPGNSDDESDESDDQHGGDQDGGDQQRARRVTTTMKRATPTAGPNGGSNGGSDGGDQNQEEEEEEEETQPGPSSNPTGSSANLTWWNGNKNNGDGAWQASVGYKNETNRHQYLELEILRVDEKGKTTTTVIKGFYVPANGTSTFSHWDNQFTAKAASSAEWSRYRKVLAITTSDQNWQPFSYPVGERPVSVLPPTLKQASDLGGRHVPSSGEPTALEVNFPDRALRAVEPRFQRHARPHHPIDDGGNDVAMTAEHGVVAHQLIHQCIGRIDIRSLGESVVLDHFRPDRDGQRLH
jgi:hypothetical protein